VSELAALEKRQPKYIAQVSAGQLTSDLLAIKKAQHDGANFRLIKPWFIVNGSF
jgi:hypothetical protein